MSQSSSTIKKTQESKDPIDQYVAEHSLRLTVEQNEIFEYTMSLPGRFL